VLLVLYTTFCLHENTNSKRTIVKKAGLFEQYIG
jgi:hypothetical protein